MNILSKLQLPSSSGLGLTVFERYLNLRISEWINQLITEVIVEQPRLHRVYWPIGGVASGRVCSNLLIFQARESSLVPVGFLTIQILQKHKSWNLCWDGRIKVVFVCIACMEKRISWDKSIFHLSKPFHPGKQWRWASCYIPHQNKGFIDHSFCSNWAVRNFAGTRLDSLAWY